MLNKSNLNYQNSREYINRLNMMLYMLLAVPLAIFVYVYLQKQNNTFTPLLEFSENVLAIVRGAFGLLVFTTIFFAYKAYRAVKKNALEEEVLRDKLNILYGGFQRKLLWLSMGNWAAAIGVLLTADAFFFGLFCVTLIVFSFNNPTLHKVAKDLLLNKEEGWRVLRGEEID